MANSTDIDTNVPSLGLLAPALIALIAGLVIHSFIIGVNVSDWWRGRSVTPVDHIVTSLGISRIGALCSLTLDLCLDSLFLHATTVIMNTVYLFFFSANIWLTSLLSIVLCLKISNLHTRLFLYLRRMILHRTGCLVVASLLLSCINSFMYLVIMITKEPTDILDSPCSFSHVIYNYIFTDFLPPIFCSISSVLLFVSLYHHTTRMKMSSNLSINLETYYSVMKLVSFTFTLYTVYFIVNIVYLIFYYFTCVTLAWLHIVFEFIPVLHSSYLIYTTAKFRNQMSKVLQNVMDFIFQRKNTKSRENIEVQVIAH